MATKEAVSPKGVADLEQVAEMIRDRREAALLEGKVTPSTSIPHFPSTPVRKSLVSIDDEEVQTYRIEITTDNVVKQSVPARFCSSSKKEEYLAEFDMVDPEGEFIPAPPITPIRRRASKQQASPRVHQSVSQTKEEKQPKESKADGSKSVPVTPTKKSGGVFASLRKRTYSLEDSTNGVEVKMPSEDNLQKVEKKTVRDLVSAPPPAPLPPPSATKPVEQQQAPKVQRITTPPHKKSGGMFASLRKRTYSLEDSKHGVEVKMPSEDKPQKVEKKTVRDLVSAAPPAPLPPPSATKPVEQQQAVEVQRTTTPPQKKSGGMFASLRKRTHSLEDSKHGVEVKMSRSSTPKKAEEKPAPQQIEDEAVRDLVAGAPATLLTARKTETSQMERSPTPKDDKQANAKPAEEQEVQRISSFKSNASSKSSRKQKKKDKAAEQEVQRISSLKSNASSKASRKQKKKDKAAAAKQESPAMGTPKVTTSVKSVEPPVATETKSAPAETAPAQEAKSAPIVATPTEETDHTPSDMTPAEASKSTPVVTPPPALETKLPSPEPTPLPAKDATKREDPAAPPAKPTEQETPNASKPKSTDDDTESTASSSTESMMAAKPRDKFYGEAAVERILERFFEKVTCTCINGRCVGNEPEEREVPDYMVVEIQKIHQKAQAKKTEIAEKREARRMKKSVDESSLRKAKGRVTSEKRSKKSGKPKKEFAMKSEKKGVPSYEWGEKVLEQDSVTTASSANQHASGVTVGQFFQKRFDLFEKSVRRGKTEEFADESSHGVETLVYDSEAEEETMEDIFTDAILNIRPVGKDSQARESAPRSGAVQSIAAKEGNHKGPEERVILLAPADEDGTESLLDGADEDGESLLDDDDESEYTTELIQVDFDPSKLGNSTDADMYLAREVLRRYAEITGISLDELIEDVVDESLASLTLDAYGFPMDRNEGSVQ